MAAIVGAILVALLAGHAAVATTPCASSKTARLCVSWAERPWPEVGDQLGELISDYGCTVPSDMAPDALQSAVTLAGLGRILRQLDRQRISYALKPDARAGESRNAGLCAYRLIVLSPAGAVEGQRPMRAASVTRPRPAMPQKVRTVPFPRLKGGYISTEDERLQEDFGRIRKSFDALAPTDKKEALTILLEFYDQWGLKEARNFIGQVARGRMRYRVDSAVARHAAEILMSIDDG